MNLQKNNSFILLVLGVCASIIGVLLGDTVPKQAGGLLIGIGAGMAALGFSLWQMRRWEEKFPEEMRKNEIEANDERNVFIRNRAKAQAGEVLQWAVMAVAWLSIALGAPVWVTLLAAGTFVLKSALELYLMSRYQREL